MLKFITAVLIVLLTITAQAKSITLNTLNTVTFRGVVDGNSVTEAQLALSKLAILRGTATYPLYLVLDSPGGSIDAGNAFIQFAKTIQNLETISIFAASMASGIAEALPGRRYVTANGIMMFHRAAGGFEGYFNDGKVEEQLRLWKNIVQEFEETNAKRLKMDIKDYKLRVISEYWLYGKEAVQKNAADEVVDLLCSVNLINKRELVTQQSLFGSSKDTWSGCPLFRAPIKEKKGA